MSSLVTGTLGGMPDGAHIKSSMFGEFNAGIVGADSYIFKVKDNLAAELSGTNTVHMSSGDWLMQGRHCYVDDAGIDFALTSGTQGMLRNDLLVATYTQQPTDPGIEAVAYSVITGTPATSNPQDPAYTEGNILLGDTTVQVPLYRVTWNGVTPGEPEPLLPVAPNLADRIGVVLYDNPAGSTGPFSLTDDLAGFSELIIEGWIQDVVSFSQFVSNPNGKTVSVGQSYLATSDLVRIAAVSLTFNGTSITVREAAWWDGNNGSNAGNLVFLQKVIGYR